MNQSDRPLVSVIIPVWGAEKLLPRCLAAVAAQTLTDWECILVEDGSPDNSGAICDEWAARDSRFRVIHQPNGGISRARNTGLDAARGRYIAFCDNDDAMGPHELEYVVEQARLHPQRVPVWQYAIDWAAFEQASALPSSPRLCDAVEMMLLFTSRGIEMQPWNKLFDGNVIRREHLRFNEELGRLEKMGEDKDFLDRYYRAFFDGRPGGYVFFEQALYYNERANDNSQATRFNQRRAAAPAEGPEPPQPGYWNVICRECRDICSRPALFANEQTARETIAHYMATLTFGVYSARALGEPLPCPLRREPAVSLLLELGRQHKTEPLTWLLMRWNRQALLARVYEAKSWRKAFYYRLDKLAHLMLPGWK